jgi:hypothetical protein
MCSSKLIPCFPTCTRMMRRQWNVMSASEHTYVYMSFQTIRLPYQCSHIYVVLIRATPTALLNWMCSLNKKKNYGNRQSNGLAFFLSLHSRSVFPPVCSSSLTRGSPSLSLLQSCWYSQAASQPPPRAAPPAARLRSSADREAKVLRGPRAPAGLPELHR